MPATHLPRSLVVLLPALLAIPLSQCRRVTERMDITETREVSSFAPKADAGATSEERFGPALRQMQTESAPSEAGVPDSPPQPALRELLTWSAPEGWVEAPPGSDPTNMRLIDLRFGPAKEGECYVSIMPGAAGGVEANLNRWRSQMGQPPYTAEEIAALPKKPIFNRDGIYAAFDGDYKSVGANEALKGYRMVGVIHSAPQATIFVKMVGPKSLVEANAEAFDQFCKSIAPKS